MKRCTRRTFRKIIPHKIIKKRSQRFLGDFSGFYRPMVMELLLLLWVRYNTIACSRMSGSLSLSLLVFYVTCNDISVIYVTAQVCRRTEEEVAPTVRNFAGFFNVPVLHRHGANLFIRWFRHTAPFSRLLRHAGDTEDVFSTLTPGVLTGDEWK